MDTPPTYPLTPSTRHHPLKKGWLIALIIIAGCIMGVYLLGIHGYLTGFKNTSSASSSAVDVVWSTSTKDGSTWYEMSPSGSITTYADLPAMIISYVMRGGGKTYILAQGKNLSSVLYEYTGSSYTPIYTSQLPLYDPSISTDGAVVSVTALHPTASSTSENVLVITPATKKAVTLGSGFGAAMLDASGVQSVVYMSGKDILAQSLLAGTWSKPQTVYSSSKTFLPNMSITSDGASSFAFSDPLVGSVQLWQVVSLNPFTASPKTIYKGAQSSWLSFENGSLVSLSGQAITSSSTSPLIINVAPLATPTQVKTIKISASQGLPRNVILISP